MSMTLDPAPRRRILSPEEIQKIGADYGLSLSGRVNTRPTALLVLFAAAMVIFLLCTLLMAIPFRFGWIRIEIMLWIALAFWFATFAVVIERFFLIIVPKFAGVTTTNALNGELHVYLTGWHIRLPWEQFTSEDYITTRAQLVRKTDGSTFVTKDGVPLVFNWTEQYGVYGGLLPLYVRTEENAITHGLEEVVEHAIQEVVVDQEVKAILKPDIVDKIVENINKKLQEEKDVQGNTLEDRFGIVVELSTVGPPDFDKDYKEALSAKVIRAIIEEDAGALAKNLGISSKDALQTVLILNKEAVSKQIFTLEADEQIAAMAPAIVAALQAFNNRAGGLRQGNRRNRPGNSPQQPTNP